MTTGQAKRQSVQILEPQRWCPENELPFARAFIASARFTYAKSVPEAPHEYCLRSWVDSNDFDRFMILIAEHGYAGRFWKQRWRYLNVDEWRYWRSRTIDGTEDIVNRSLVSGASFIECCKLGTATGGKHHSKTCDRS